MNRVIRDARPRRDLRHRARATAVPALVANTYLEGTYTEVYPHVGRDEDGLRRLFRQFSFPGGIPSHVAPETPGLDPRGRRAGLRARARVRRRVRQPRPAGRAASSATARPRPGPLAASWHSNKFLDPAATAPCCPILHLNGYKIANPTVLARIPRARAHRVARGLRLRAALRRRARTRRRCTS